MGSQRLAHAAWPWEAEAVLVKGERDVYGRAIFGEPKDRYRYVLLREWSDGPRSIAFCGVNPSTAVAEKDDNTVKKCWQFARAWGYDRMFMLNAFALRSTDPAGLHDVDDPTGPDNDAWLLRVHNAVERTVVAWGNNVERIPGRHARVLTVLRASATPLHTFGLTNDGFPMHPLSRGKKHIPKTATTVPYVDQVVA